ncbi:YciI family protein [Devosia sp. SL43]|uniref:YciI family protein n=1 Tax=Devosia sp. SL43 TaxID=2806348 RepID=UPI001F3CAC91|nr:YciI family protein [Devosia sp. SL43]UJW84264.1 YciI family protein [Devosia sp. SL43]
MPLFAMIAKDKPDMGDKRIATRPVHLEHLKAMGEKLVLAGALMGADGNPEGSLLVLEADTIEAATASFMADPFVAEGIFGSVEVKPWRVAINHTNREF